MKIIECKSTSELEETYPIASQLYDFSIAKYLKYLEEMMSADYRMIALYEDDECVAISGFRVGRRFYCGKYLHIDNLVVGEKHRSQGYANELIDWMRVEAKRLNCDCVLADTYTENARAQGLFKKQGFQTRGYHLKLGV